VKTLDLPKQLLHIHRYSYKRKPDKKGCIPRTTFFHNLCGRAQNSRTDAGSPLKETT
jgi:hypothetical protein